MRGTIVLMAALAACLPPDRAIADSLPAKLPSGEQRAFPTAEGHGAAARGGRGGEPLFVTTLAESGPGSLRACIEAAMPRTCIFRVSGTITLDEASLVVSHPFLTIAGETAPGDGIAIRNGPRQLRPSLEIKAHDVIVRHIRLRPGPHEIESCCSGALGIYGRNTRDVIVDHVSASWGSDESIDSEHATDITIQWSILSEPLYSGGPGKRHRARNMLLTRGGGFSIHNNLFASGIFRNPQIVPELPGMTVNVVNNVLYSPRWQYVISFSAAWTDIQANVIGNYKIAGERIADDRLVNIFEDFEDPGDVDLFLEGNIDETYIPDPSSDQRRALLPDAPVSISDRPHPGPQIDAKPAVVAFENVLERAGATRPVRDAVDQRIVSEVRDRRGRLVFRDPEDVGGWPVLKTAPFPADADDDGLPDDWELRHGLDPEDRLDGRLDADGDGWTNLEEYLHHLAAP